MTTATKTRPTKTREEELADLLTQHRGVLTEFEEQASAWEHQASEFDARAEAALADFSGPVTDLPKSVDEDRVKALRKRQGAADLRKRARAYAASNGLEMIAAEHDQLRRERIASEEFEAATKEAATLIPELEARAAWLYLSHLQAAAVRQRYLEAGNRLMDLVQRHRITVDVARYTKLAVQAQEAAGREERAIVASADPLAWSKYLPEPTPLELPAELRTPVNIAQSSVNQRGPEPDRSLPKDHALRMAAAAVPSPRNADGTIAGAYVPTDPFTPQRFAPRPRTVAEDRAAIAKVAAELEPDNDGASDA